jgi:hypothetical protein
MGGGPNEMRQFCGGRIASLCEQTWRLPVGSHYSSVICALLSTSYTVLMIHHIQNVLGDAPVAAAS